MTVPEHILSLTDSWVGYFDNLGSCRQTKGFSMCTFISFKTEGPPCMGEEISGTLGAKQPELSSSLSYSDSAASLIHSGATEGIQTGSSVLTSEALCIAPFQCICFFPGMTVTGRVGGLSPVAGVCFQVNRSKENKGLIETAWKEAWVVCAVNPS